MPKSPGKMKGDPCNWLTCYVGSTVFLEISKPCWRNSKLKFPKNTFIAKASSHTTQDLSISLWPLRSQTQEAGGSSPYQLTQQVPETLQVRNSGLEAFCNTLKCAPLLWWFLKICCRRILHSFFRQRHDQPSTSHPSIQFHTYVQSVWKQTKENTPRPPNDSSALARCHPNRASSCHHVHMPRTWPSAPALKEISQFCFGPKKYQRI